MQLLRKIIQPGGLAALALLVPILAGCGGGGGGGGDNGSGGGIGNNGGGGGGAATSVSVTQPNGLTATLSENAATVSAGSGVTYTLTLANNTAVTVPINYSASAPTVPAVGLVVRDSAGNQAFQPIPGFPPLDNTTLAPGQSQTETFSTGAFGATGTYTATATFTDGNTPSTVGPLAVVAQ